MREESRPSLFSAQAIMFFAGVFALGQLLQFIKILSQRSTNDISGLWVITIAFMVISGTIYGFGLNDKTVIRSNALRVPFALSVVLAYFHYSHTSYEVAASTIVLFLIVIMLVFPRWHKYVVFLAMILILLGSLHQPYKIWQNGSRGNLSGEMIHCAFLSNIFWLIYSYKNSKWLIFAFSVASAPVLGTTIVLWWLAG